ncbi:S46 family peptidase [Pedobacter steynii]
MLEDASQFSPIQKVTAVNKVTSKGANSLDVIDQYTESIFEVTKLKEVNYVLNVLLQSPKSISAYNDGLLLFEDDIAKQIDELKPEKDRRDGLLNKLMGDYVNIKEKFLKKDFIPDANSTLRLTYGYVKGYSPADAS